MSDSHRESDSCQEERALQEGVQQIVVSRERTPRNPRWQRAWWRTLERYNARLTALRQEAGATEDAAESPAKGPADCP